MSAKLIMDLCKKPISGHGGPPVKVKVNMYIKSFGPVSETNMEYDLDCYFRQEWKDDRMAFRYDGLPELAMNWQFLDKVLY